MSNPDTNQELTYAPPREALKIFGGSMSYSEFRQNNNYVDIIYEPSIPLIAFLEETTPINDTSRKLTPDQNLFSFMN